MEAFGELNQGFLWALLDLRKVDTALPFFAAGNELADE